MSQTCSSYQDGVDFLECVSPSLLYRLKTISSHVKWLRDFSQGNRVGVVESVCWRPHCVIPEIGPTKLLSEFAPFVFFQCEWILKDWEFRKMKFRGVMKFKILRQSWLFLWGVGGHWELVIKRVVLWPSALESFLVLKIFIIYEGNL